MQFQLLEPIEYENDKPDVPENDPIFIALNKIFELCAVHQPCPCKHKRRCLYLQDMISEKSSLHELNTTIALDFEIEIRRFIHKD